MTARRRPLDPSAMTVRQAAKLLGVAGERIAAHVAAGAPTDARGRIHLVRYAAWLILRAAGGR